VASLQKTYKGDLTTSIAGAIWNRIKQADERKQLDKSGASKEVKDAATELVKDDSSSLPVQNSDVRETIVRIFTPLDGKLLQVKNRVSNLSDKVNLIAGGLADTQKLLVSRNDLLEDKFDEISKVIGNVSAIEKRRDAESKFEDLENSLERGFDLSGTFAFEKTNTGSYGILGKLLSGILGNRFTAQLVNQIAKSLIPRGVRARGRLLRKSLLPARKLVKQLKTPGTSIAKNILKPLGLFGGKKAFGILGKGFSQILGKDYAAARFGQFLARKLQKTYLSSDPVVRGILRQLQEVTTVAGPGGLKIGNTADDLADLIIADFEFRRAFPEKPLSKAIKRSTKKVTTDVAPNLIGGISRKITKVASPKVLNNTLSNVDGIFAKAITNPKIQKAIIDKIGKEGAEKIGIKLAAGGTKGGFPLFGTAYAAVEGLVRLVLGDPEGMMLSFGSGIPAAGWGFAVIDILRDIDREAYNKHIRPNLPIPNDTDIAGYFMDAFNIGIDQFERGNTTFKAPTGMGANVNVISEILGVTQAFGAASGFGSQVSGLISSEGLSGFPIPRVNYNFDVGNVGSGLASSNQPLKQGREEELKMTRKLDKKLDEDDDDDNKEEDKVETRRNDGKPEGNNQWWDFLDVFANPAADGEGGTGGVISQTPIMGIGGGSTIEFYGQQGRDRSGEPGVDFSFQDYKNNYNLFPGYVLETGLLYGKGYGNVVVVRSTDPSNGRQFDALYSHFPDGGINVKTGQQVAAGDLLGSVGFVSVDTPGVPQIQPNNAGNMSGWHTSVDFFEPDSPARYSNADKLINLITGAGGQTPHGLLEKLKPSNSSGNQSSLNNIEANSNLSTAMTSMVENGSSERLMTQKKSRKRQLPIVIINNQSINANQTTIPMTGSSEKGNFFEAYNLARYTV
tara:strand:- start:1514 stop:4222 length:2709 start_codon:yes stop_codon:yes gene_type:complete